MEKLIIVIMLFAVSCSSNSVSPEPEPEECDKKIEIYNPETGQASWVCID